MSFRWGWNLRPEIRAEASFFVYIALSILLLPLSWILAALAAAAFHELCHLSMLRRRKIPVVCLRLRWGGAVLETGSMTAGEELLCASAGPLGSFLLVFLVHRLPRVAVCALIQGLFNLFPLGDLDGARILRCIIRRSQEKYLANRGN